MKPVLSSAAMREADRVAIEELGIPGHTLMEVAGREAARFTLAFATDSGRDAKRIAVLCGKGNNGGDGLVVARWLADAGCSVTVCMVAGREGLSPEAARNLAILERLGLSTITEDFAELEGHDVLVDALLGTGQRTAPREPMRRACEWMNGQPALRVALDVPTGLDSDTGMILEVAVEAHLTVTMGALKTGLLMGDGPDAAGTVRVADIGIPRSVLAGMAEQPGCALASDDAFVRQILPTRLRRAHKYHTGPALVIGGSTKYPGAPVLAATAAARVGSGYVVAGLPTGVEWRGPTEIPVVRHEDTGEIARWVGRSRSVLLGPGLGRGEGAVAVVGAVLDLNPTALVVDADGLRALKDLGRLENGPSAARILTPHGGEFAYMTGEGAALDNPVRAATEWSRAWNSVLVLKGAPTVIADPAGRSAICTAGGPELATAGTGDVLSGLCVGLLAMGIPAFDAAVAATHLGGAASEAYVARRGQGTMMASDIVRLLPQVISERFAP